MEYIINRSALLPLIEEEISRVAAESRSQDGSSIYDLIRIRSLDHPTIERFEDDAINALRARLADIVSSGEEKLTFLVPDFAVSETAACTDEITRYIVLSTVASWFLFKELTGRVEAFATRATTAMDKAVTMLKRRKAPARRYHAS